MVAVKIVTVYPKKFVIQDVHVIIMKQMNKQNCRTFLEKTTHFVLNFTQN